MVGDTVNAASGLPPCGGPASRPIITRNLAGRWATNGLALYLVKRNARKIYRAFHQRLPLQPCLRSWAETSQDQKVVVGECKAGGELGKLCRPAGRIAIAVIEQLTCIGFVDDAVAGVLGGAG
jgi:hypothetical protein